MRRLLIGLVVTATTALMPLAARADNQEFAEQIKQTLNSSGQMHGDYKIGVAFNNGTATLRGTVSSNADKAAAVGVVKQVPGVRDVVDNLTVPLALQPAAGTLAPEQLPRTTSPGTSTGSWSAGERSPAAQRVASSFTPVRPQPAGATEPQSPAPQATATAVATAPAVAAPTAQTVSLRPLPMGYAQACPAAAVAGPVGMVQGGPMPAYVAGQGGAVSPAPVRYDQPHLPCYAWPTYAAYPNYAGVTYPKQYSPTAWPYIGPFYPYPQVPLGWRKVTLEWDDGWWMLDFKNHY